MKYLIILSFLFGAGFLDTGLSAAETLIQNSSSDVQYVAKRKKKRRKKRRSRKRRKRKKKAYMNNAASVSRVSSQKGLKFSGGIASMDSISPFIIGADYLLPFKENLSMLGGASLWTSSEGGATSTLMHFDGGLGYHIDLSDSMNIELGGRVGMAYISVTAGSYSGSETWLAVTPYGALNFLTGSSVIGAEIRKPIFLTGDNNSFDGIYLMGFYRMFL